jgi:hypothetical protein
MRWKKLQRFSSKAGIVCPAFLFAFQSLAVYSFRNMAKLRRDDRFKMLMPDAVVEPLIELKEKQGINLPMKQMFTHLFDYDISRTEPLYVILVDEDNQYWPQHLQSGEELGHFGPIEEAIWHCQRHHDRRSLT